MFVPLTRLKIFYNSALINNRKNFKLTNVSNILNGKKQVADYVSPLKQNRINLSKHVKKI